MDFFHIKKKENKKVKISSQIIIKSKNLNNFDIDYDFRQNKKEINLMPHLNNNVQFQEGPSPFLLLHILVSIFFITVKANFVSVCHFYFFTFFLFFFFLFFSSSLNVKNVQIILLYKLQLFCYTNYNYFFLLYISLMKGKRETFL